MAHRSRRKNPIAKVGKHVVTVDEQRQSSQVETAAERRLYPSHAPSVRGPSSAAKFITVAQLCERWAGVSFMFIERRLKDDETFPRPRKFGRLRFFDLAEIENWERAQVLKSDAAAA